MKVKTKRKKEYNYCSGPQHSLVPMSKNNQDRLYSALDMTDIFNQGN